MYKEKIVSVFSCPIDYTCYYQCYQDAFSELESVDTVDHPHYRTEIQVTCKSSKEGQTVNGRVWITEPAKRA